MFNHFFYLLRRDGIPVTVQEYLTLLEALDKEVIRYRVDDFYFLAKTILVKREKHLDRFDTLFAHYFKGMEYIPDSFIKEIPKQWLEEKGIRHLSEEDKKRIESMGGLDALKKRFEELLKEQKERHQGGSKWIGTGGVSPFGAYGYNPEGYRIGQNESRHRRAVKVWDKRSFKNLDDNVSLDTRNIKLALKRLRHFTREGVPDEFDIEGTIRKTSQNAGMLDVQMIPSKQNRVKVLMLFDIGGSMDGYIQTCSELFSAAKHEFKHLVSYYFHNCVYESVWRDNTRRYKDKIPTFDLLHKYNADYKLILVGDASMSPYEIVVEGGSVEHYNAESGLIWMRRLLSQYKDAVWINPTLHSDWNYVESIYIIRQLMENRMYPMTIEGISQAMKQLV